MTHESVATIRMRAEMARRLADQTHNDRARAELRQIADDLDAEAAKLENNIVPMPKPE